MSNLRGILQKNLADIINNSKMSKKEIAERLGVSAASVTKWVKGDNSPDIELIAKICNLFDTNINTLLQLPKTQTFTLTEHEKEVITAYRSKPEMQQAVDRLLGVEENKVVGQVFRAACNGKNPEYITLTDEQRKKLEEAPSTDEL